MIIATFTMSITSTPIAPLIQRVNRTHICTITRQCDTSTRTIRTCITDTGIFTPSEIVLLLVSDNNQVIGRTNHLNILDKMTPISDKIY